MHAMASYFPKALLYREWREGRLIYLLAGALTLLPGILAVTSYWSIPDQVPYRQMLLNNYWQTFYMDTTKFGTHSIPPIYFIIIWIAVPVLRLVTERSRGSLAMLLSSPVKRGDWLRVKFWFGFCTLTLGSAVWLLLLWLLHFQASPANLTPTEMLFREVGIHWIVYVSFYALAFFVSLCVTNTIGAVLICLGISMAPMWLSTTLHEIFPNSAMGLNGVTFFGDSPTGLVAPQGSWIYLIQWLSPMSMELDLQGFTWLNGWLYGYLALAVIAYIGGMKYFRQMRAEAFQNMLTRSSLWYWLLTGFSLVVGSGVGGMVVSNLSMNANDYNSNHHAAIFTAAFIIASAAIWLAIWAFFATRDLRRERRQLLGK